MPKAKSKRAAAKRFKFTGGGKIRRMKAFRRHLLSSKSRTRKRELREKAHVDESNVKAVLSVLPYGDKF
jgi:large subunit ribosomal protein L35